MLHIGAEPNERWIGVMPSCKAEVRHPFPVPLVCWQGSIHWEEGPGLGTWDTGGKVQVPQLTCVRSSPGSKWAFGGNLLLSLMLQVWHLAEICKTGCWDCLCAHFPQDPDMDGVGANCAMLACFLSITFELKCFYCRWVCGYVCWGFTYYFQKWISQVTGSVEAPCYRVFALLLPPFLIKKNKETKKQKKKEKNKGLKELVVEGYRQIWM